MPKFDALRTLSATGKMQWADQPITLLVVSNYTFNAAHATVQDIQSSGGAIVASVKLVGKLVTATGYAQSSAVPLKMVPAGSGYGLILLHDTSAGKYPLVSYPSALNVDVTGNMLVRPQGSVGADPGTWFRF